MPRTPDRFPGTREEDAVLFEPDGTHPATNGEVRYVTAQGFRFFEEGVEKGLGLQALDHASIRQLIHLVDEGGPFEGFASGAYREILPSASPFPTSVIWWTSSAKTHKILEETVTYNVLNRTITVDQWKVYDVDGSTVLATVTDNISYVGVLETNRTRTIT